MFYYLYELFGEMAEWSKATVLKTVVSLVGTQGSNPCFSASIVLQHPYKDSF